jgi:hypothetical protein
MAAGTERFYRMWFSFVVFTDTNQALLKYRIAGSHPAFFPMRIPKRGFT